MSLALGMAVAVALRMQLTPYLVPLVLVASACRMAAMPVPLALQGNSDAWQVKEDKSFFRTKAIHLGQFDTQKIDRSWIHGSGHSVNVGWFGGYSTKERHESYEFIFGENKNPEMKVKCVSRFMEDVQRVTTFWGDKYSVDSNVMLGCMIKMEGTAVGELRIAGLPDSQLRGGISVDGFQFAIESVHKIEGSSIPIVEPTGYTIALDGEVIAAVQHINTPVVHMSKEMGPRLHKAIALTASMLILFRPLEGEES